jgi:hypothetical protein
MSGLPSFLQAMKDHGVSAYNSSVSTGHRRTTLAIDGETIGWVDHFDGERTWSAIAQTPNGTVDRGDFHRSKTEAMNEVISYRDGGLAYSIWKATQHD